jgi:hypothetical protein
MPDLFMQDQVALPHGVDAPSPRDRVDSPITEAVLWRKKVGDFGVDVMVQKAEYPRAKSWGCLLKG